MDDLGNCFYDACMAQLERKELRVGLSKDAVHIRTHQVLTLILTEQFFSISQNEFVLLLSKVFCK